MRFNKKRKYDRLLEICKGNNLKYKDNGINNQGNYEVIVWPKYDHKEFTEMYYNCSRWQLECILDEIPGWDATFSGVFTSTSKASIDFIQFAYAATGRRSTIYVDKREDKYLNGYCADVIPSDNDKVGIRNRHKKTEMEEYKTVDGYKYCFTVPSGMLVLRRNGKIFVTGNSGVGKSTITRELALHLMQQGHTVGNMYLEESQNDTARTYIAMRNEVHPMRFAIHPDMIPEQTIRKDVDFLNQNGVFYKHFGSLEDDALVSKLRYMVKVKHCDFIILDHISMVVSGRASQNERKDIDMLMTTLATFVVDNNVGLVLVSHLSRNKEKNWAKGAIPDLTDLRGSAALEQLSWSIIGASRDQQGDIPNMINFHVLKNRSWGFLGNAGACQYQPDTGRLVELKEEYLDD
jgi:archaellum biogenesis ATPase FlaH